MVHYFHTNQLESSRSSRAGAYTTRPLLVVDLDGTIRRNRRHAEGVRFINAPEYPQLIPGAREALSRWKEEGFMIYAASNQGGIACGHKTTTSMMNEVRSLLDTHIGDPPVFSGLFWCPCHPSGNVEPFARESVYRKPRAGMLASIEQNVTERGFAPDWNRSWVVGDSEADLGMAKTAGVRFMSAQMFRDGQMPWDFPEWVGLDTLYEKAFAESGGEGAHS